MLCVHVLEFGYMQRTATRLLMRCSCVYKLHALCVCSARFVSLVFAFVSLQGYIGSMLLKNYFSLIGMSTCVFVKSAVQCSLRLTEINARFGGVASHIGLCCMFANYG